MMPWPKDSTEKSLMSAWQLTIKLPYDLIGFIKLCPGESEIYLPPGGIGSRFLLRTTLNHNEVVGREGRAGGYYLRENLLVTSDCTQNGLNNSFYIRGLDYANGREFPKRDWELPLPQDNWHHRLAMC